MVNVDGMTKIRSITKLQNCIHLLYEYSKRIAQLVAVNAGADLGG